MLDERTFMDIYRRLEDATVIAEPFPYLILEDALDSGFCDALVREMPPLDMLTRGAPLETNKRFTMSHVDALADVNVANNWKHALCQGLSQRFLDRVLQLFAPHIRREFVDFEDRFGTINELQSIPRQISGRPNATIGMDAQIAVNTPVLSPRTTVRGPHLDRLDKLFVGLLYLRSEQDDSDGGALELYVPDCEKPVFAPKRMLPRERVQLVSTIPYRRNTLVMFLNTPRSLHGVSPRGVTPHPRYFINFVGETTEPLYHVDIQPAQPETTMISRSTGANWLGRLKSALNRPAA